MSVDDPPGLSFVDTNVLVYALASDDPVRSPIAQQLLRELMEFQLFRTSTQVLQELFVTLTRKVRTPLSAEQAIRYLDLVAVWPIAPIDYSAVREAAQLSSSARLSFWDSLVVVSAKKMGALHIYTEDLNHGQAILGVKIVNPFRRG